MHNFNELPRDPSSVAMMLDAPPRPSTLEVGAKVGSPVKSTSKEWLVLFALLALVFLFGSYYIVRSGGGQTADDDAQASFIRSMGKSGSLIPSGDVYTQGYGYAVISNAILAFTGLDLQTLLQVVYPLLSALLVLPAWALYRELSGSAKVANIATLLLFIQPEFLYVIMRASHERITRTLMIVAIWLLVRSFRFSDRRAHFGIHLILFYSISYALISVNSFIGNTFIFAIVTAMMAAWVIHRLFPGFESHARDTAVRFAYVSLSLLILGYIFIFYVYPPSAHLINNLNLLFDKVLALYFGALDPANSYAQVTSAWRSPEVLLLIFLNDYLLIAVSATIWVRYGLLWLFGKEKPPTVGIWLVWLLYSSFAFQGAISIMADRAGMMGGNFQLRAFPSFAMAGVALVAVSLSRVHFSLLGRLAATGLLILLAALSIFKVTNEPTLSNNWTFYSTAELQALEWAEHHQRNSVTWVGPDNRLQRAASLVIGQSRYNNRWDTYGPKTEARTFLFSSNVHMQHSVLDTSIPPAIIENRVYDNGTAQLFRLRPRTPQQR